MPRRVIKFLSLIICFCLIFEQSGFAQIAGQLDISGHIAQLRNSLIQDKFRPLHLRYLSYDNLSNNFKLLLDKGDLKNLRPQELENATKELLNYFFVGISLPNDSFWVNLRPDSPEQIIDDALATTDVGKILLEADLQLKRDTAKFTSPETPEGKEYWDKLYQKAEEIFGSANITIPTLTRPWIVPDEIIIRETQDNAYIYKATLKVMLEQDYLKDSAIYNFKDGRLKTLNEYSSQLIRELIIPKLTKEINTSKRYASLRQVYYSLILAQWFKSRFYGKGGLYSWLIDKKNLNGITSKENWSKSTYFKAYQQSFKDGEYNIKTPISTPFGQTIRSYFSGGINFDIGQGGSSPVITDNGYKTTGPLTAISGDPKIQVDVLKGNRQLPAIEVSSPVTIEDPYKVQIKSSLIKGKPEMPEAPEQPTLPETPDYNIHPQSTAAPLLMRPKTAIIIIALIVQFGVNTFILPPNLFAALQHPVNKQAQTLVQKKPSLPLSARIKRQINAVPGKYYQDNLNRILRNEQVMRAALRAASIEVFGYRMPIENILTLIAAESAGEQDAQSAKDAHGLTQIHAPEIERINNDLIKKWYDEKGNEVKLVDVYQKAYKTIIMAFLPEVKRDKQISQKRAQEEIGYNIMAGVAIDHMNHWRVNYVLNTRLKKLSSESETLNARLSALQKVVPKKRGAKNFLEQLYITRRLGVLGRLKANINSLLSDGKQLEIIKQVLFNGKPDVLELAIKYGPNWIRWTSRKEPLQYIYRQARYRALLAPLLDEILRQQIARADISSSPLADTASLSMSETQRLPSAGSPIGETQRLVASSAVTKEGVSRRNFLKWLGVSAASLVALQLPEQDALAEADSKEKINTEEYKKKQKAIEEFVVGQLPQEIQDAYKKKGKTEAVKLLVKMAKAGKLGFYEKWGEKIYIIPVEDLSTKFSLKITRASILSRRFASIDKAFIGDKTVNQVIERRIEEEAKVLTLIKGISGLIGLAITSWVAHKKLIKPFLDRKAIELIEKGKINIESVTSYGSGGTLLIYAGDIYIEMLWTGEILIFRKNNTIATIKRTNEEEWTLKKNQILSALSDYIRRTNDIEALFALLAILAQYQQEVNDEKIIEYIDREFKDYEVIAFIKELVSYGFTFGKHTGSLLTLFQQKEEVFKKLKKIQQVAPEFKYQPTISKEIDPEMLFIDYLVRNPYKFLDNLNTILGMFNPKVVPYLETVKSYIEEIAKLYAGEHLSFVFNIIANSILFPKEEPVQAVETLKQLCSIANFLKGADLGTRRVEDILKFYLSRAYDYRSSLSTFLVSEGNKILVNEKAWLVHYLSEINASREIFDLLKISAEEIEHARKLEFYRNINNILKNEGMIESDALEDWGLILKDYIKRFGYLTNRDLILVHRYLSRQMPLDDKRLGHYKLQDIGITSTGINGLEQLENMIKNNMIKIINEKEISNSDLGNPVIEAIIGGLTGFSTTQWGHGSNRKIKLKEFVMQFNELKRQGRIPPLDPAFNQEEAFLIRRKGKIEFTQDAQKKFEEYVQLIKQAVGLSEESLDKQIERLKQIAFRILENKQNELGDRITVSDEKVKKGIRIQLDKLTNTAEKLNSSQVVSLLDLAIPMAGQKEFQDLIALILVTDTLNNPQNAIFRKNLLNNINEGPSVLSFGKIIELKEEFIKEHALSGLDKDTKKALLNVLNTRIFEEELFKIKILKNDSVTVKAFATKGILGEMAGDIGNACYTAQSDIMLRKDPSPITAIIFTTGEGLETKFIGSMLILENTSNGKPVFILRAVNPSEEFLSQYSAEDFLENAIRYIEKIGKIKGVELIVAPIGNSGALSNRGEIHTVFQKFTKGEKVDLDKKETFNGYNITKGVAAQVVSHSSSPLAEPNSTTSAGSTMQQESASSTAEKGNSLIASGFLRRLDIIEKTINSGDFKDTLFAKEELVRIRKQIEDLQNKLSEARNIEERKKVIESHMIIYDLEPVEDIDSHLSVALDRIKILSEKISSEMACLHPNDIAAGLTPDSTIEERSVIVDIKVAAGFGGLPVTRENIHPIIFDAVVEINKIKGIKTSGSGPDVIYGSITEEGEETIIKSHMRSAAEGLPIKLLEERSESNTFFLLLSGNVKLKNAKAYWDEFVRRLKEKSAGSPMQQESASSAAESKIESLPDGNDGHREERIEYAKKVIEYMGDTPVFNIGGVLAPCPAARIILKYSAAEDILALVSIGSVPLAGGTYAVVLKTPKGNVIRIGWGENIRYEIPEMLQPMEKKKIGIWHIELLPYASSAGVTEADVQDMDRRLREKGYYLNESSKENLGFLRDGRIVVIDPGAVNPVKSSSPLKKNESVTPVVNNKGGIDLRALPIVTQPMPAMPGVNLSAPPLSQHNINLDNEWQEIENMLNAGIIPSCERIKEYLEASCKSQDCSTRIDNVLSCLADILRLEEERVASTEPVLKELLVLLESDKPAAEMQLALAKIIVSSKEPEVVEP